MKYSTKSLAVWGLVRAVASAKPALHSKALPGRRQVFFPVLFGSREDARRYRRTMPAPHCYRPARVAGVFTWTA